MAKLLRKLGKKCFPWFKPRRWSNYDNALKDGRKLVQMARSSLDRDPATGRKRKRVKFNSFEDYVAEKSLSKARQARMQREYLQASIGMFVLGFVILMYITLGLHSAGWLSIVVGYALSLMVFVQALAQHIHYYQFKHRRLDIAFSQWLTLILGGDLPPLKKRD